MKALSIQQPWAWAVVTGRKSIENRPWRTHFRGRLLIHAAKRSQYLGQFGEGEPPRDQLAFGAIVGSVEVYDCVPVADVHGQRHAQGPYCWLLRDPQAFDVPVPFSGQQSLFNVPDDFAPIAPADLLDLAAIRQRRDAGERWAALAAEAGLKESTLRGRMYRAGYLTTRAV